MQISEFMGADFEPLARIVGDARHYRHGEHSFWQGADELCDYLSHTDKGFVARDDEDKLVGAILVRSPREQDHNETMRMHWLSQRTRLSAMATALGINARADVLYLNEENELMRQASRQLGSAGVGIVKLLILAPEARGKGVGRALYERGLAWLCDHGARTVRLVTDDECDWRFYEHLGMARALEQEASDNPGFHQYVYELSDAGGIGDEQRIDGDTTRG